MRPHKHLAPRLARLALLALLLALAVPAGARADFGIESFSAVASNQDHSEDTLAGSHPYEYTVSFAMNQNESHTEVEGTLSELFVDLPPGFLGNPQALPRCSRSDFVVATVSTCPGNTQVGVLEFEFPGGGGGGSALYNLTPTPGSAATLGTHIDIHNAVLDASVRTGSDYGVSAADLTVPTVVELQQVRTRIWGLPMDESHDALRFCIGDPEEPQFQGCPSDAAPEPFLTLGTRCGVALETTLRVRSVQGDADSATFKAPALKGCEGLGFQPQIKARPQTGAADSPTGLEVGIEIPQSNQVGARASAHLKDTTVTLPAGLAVNPSAADGLGACALAQIGFKGTEEGRLAFTAAAPQCPDASKLGTVAVKSPLIDHPLPGAVYLAKQGENPFGSLLALYVTVDDPLTGVVVKLAGEVQPDPLTGQLKASFQENPQLPFEELELRFFGGPRATLTTPPTCGTYATTSLLTPWSAPEGKAVKGADSFPISEAAGGGACPASEAQMPNAPEFQAGTTAPLAGAYSPFVLKVSREDGSQRLAALNLRMPAGLSAKLAGVAECSEPQIAAAEARKNPGEGALELASPSCPASSQVGTVTVGAGSGAPFYVSGRAYLAGPYKSAPLSLVIITPAVAGPFDLGTVVVRSALFVDESNAQVSVKSDPIPQILAGIPLDVRSVAVHVDREQFTLNPTSCQAKEVRGEAISPLGLAAPLAARFALAGCRRLAFAPHLSLSLRGQMQKTGNPALRALLTYPKGGGYANLARVAVTLPASEFIDQFHISNPCTRPEFAAGACPPASVLGSARAYTPLLDEPLQGKVYFRSNGGERELPDVVADLGGQVHFVLVGFVDSVGRAGSETSRTRNTFALVPDAPVSKFELNLFGGKRGLLENSANLCRSVPRANVRLSAQNGLTQNTNQTIATSCHRRARHARRGGR